MIIYTKTGDKGNTSLYDGISVSKDDLRVECYGTIDELNSMIGFSKNFTQDEEIIHYLIQIQNELFRVASQLATQDSKKVKYPISDNMIIYWENIMDVYISKMPTPGEFIIPGSSIFSGSLHVARTICRRAERRVISFSRQEEVSPVLIKYINRLSDVLYTLARFSEKEKQFVQYPKEP